MANPTYISAIQFNNMRTTPLNFVEIEGVIDGVSMNLAGREDGTNRLVFTMSSTTSTNITESTSGDLSLVEDTAQPGTDYYFWYDIGTSPTGEWTLIINGPGGSNVIFKKRTVGQGRPPR
jgi:hypothetical protein